MNWTAPKIRQLRLCLGWSRTDLARRLQCQVSDVEKWETGHDYPSFQQLRHLDLIERHRSFAQQAVQRFPKAESYLDAVGQDQAYQEEIEH